MLPRRPAISLALLALARRFNFESTVAGFCRSDCRNLPPFSK